MLEVTLLNEEQQGWLRMLSDASQLLLMVVNDVLDYTKMDAGAMVLERAPVDVGALVRGSIKLFQQRAQSRRITLETDVVVPLATGAASGAPHGYVLTDSMRLKKLLGNLVSNALKFTPEGGKVTV